MIDASTTRRVACTILALCQAFCASAQTVSPSSVEHDVAREWQDILDHGDRSKVLGTYGTVNQLSNDDGVIQAELCTEHKKALDEALIANPVGLAVWYAAFQCADLLQDSTEAERRLARFEALVRYAFEQSPEDGGRPIRVLAENDVWAFVEASGQELIYSYYDPIDNRRYLQLKVGLWDEETQRERMLAFDYLDTLVRLNRSEPYAPYPLHRMMLRESLIEGFSEYQGSLGADAHDLLVATRKPAVSDRLDSLETLAEKGSWPAALLLFSVCENVPKTQCGARGVDVLLPFAEARMATAMVILAGAYARGSVVPQDKEAARSLLDAADARLGDHKGREQFAVWAMAQSQFREAWPMVRNDIEEAAKSGSPVAISLLAVAQSIQRKDRPLTKRLRRQLQSAANGGHPLAQHTHGLGLILSGSTEEGHAWIEKAAANGMSESQSLLGFALYAGDGIPKDQARALHWLSEAAHAGNTKAMHHLAKHYAGLENNLQNRLQTQGWLQSAAYSRHSAASMDLAELFESEQEGLVGDGTHAANIYRGLLARPDFTSTPEAAVARLRLAGLLKDGRGGKVDRDEAERLLKLDAEQGVSASQLALAILYLESRKTEDHALGMDWLGKAIAAKDQDAQNFHAFALWYGYRMPMDKKKAMGILQELVDNGYSFAHNNFAWLLCTAHNAEDRDAKRGLALMDELDKETMGWGALDTIAACQAADGAFDEAIATQQGVVDAAKQSGTPAAVLSKLQAKLVNYQNKQITIELTSDMFKEGAPLFPEGT